MRELVFTGQDAGAANTERFAQSRTQDNIFVNRDDGFPVPQRSQCFEEQFIAFDLGCAGNCFAGQGGGSDSDGDAANPKSFTVELLAPDINPDCDNGAGGYAFGHNACRDQTDCRG